MRLHQFTWIFIAAAGLGCSVADDPAPQGNVASSPGGEHRQELAPEAPTIHQGEPEGDPTAAEPQNPLIRGLHQALDLSPLAEDQTDLESELEEADTLLSRIKRENYEALRQANRQVRLRGAHSPNLLFIVAQGLQVDEISCYGADAETPQIDRLARCGVRCTNYFAPVPHDVYWKTLLSGRSAGAQQPPVTVDDAVLAEMLWQAGYATHWVGDCSGGGLFENIDPAVAGFDDWFGLRDEDALDDAYPEFVEARGGARLQVTDNADGRNEVDTADLFTRAAQAHISRLCRGRPFFLLVAYPETAAADPARLDAKIGALVDHLAKEGIAGNTVIFLTARGGPQAPVAENPQLGRQAPMIVVLPMPPARSATSDHPWSAVDVAPTLADAVSALHRPKTLQGDSAWSALRAAAAASVTPKAP